jgi:group II intron reverse transcriptase/maturase
VKDRVVQAALKNILEPIFEADFYPTSYGFRPGKRVHGALEHLRLLMRPKKVRTGNEIEYRLPYQVAIEGDIKGCFDNISHHGLMKRVRRRIGDRKITRLVLAFLKAGVLTEGQFLRSDAGTPQGGILSPLLANIALSAIEERYRRHVWPRHTPTALTDQRAIKVRAEKTRRYDRQRGLPVVFPIRYADDFLLLVSVPPGAQQLQRALEAAQSEKALLAAFLKDELGLELSETKTFVTPVTNRLRFLGHHVLVRHHRSKGWPVCLAVIPKDRSQQLRKLIKNHFGRDTTHRGLDDRLKQLNPKLRGWSYFYRHAWGAKSVFDSLDNYVWWVIFRWLRKKHRGTALRILFRRYGRRTPRFAWNEV